MKRNSEMLRSATAKLVGAGAIMAAGAFCGTANAGFYNDGKVLLTGGVVTIDGAGGGGITPWATISGYGTRDGINGGLHYTFAYLPNYSLNSYGATFGFYDRFELSYTRINDIDFNLQICGHNTVNIDPFGIEPDIAGFG